MNKIQIKNITKKYNNLTALDDVHFTGLSGRHSVLERPLSGVNGHPFFS